ncbi:DUF87 domain-containing protein [Candidatus Dojkabacteria bacterium]|nr:DUF87 domain-containing protein [Candidatus Dojkabacteria bacterium]
MDPENFKIIGVTRDIVSIEILDSKQFDNHFNIGSYIKIPFQSDSSDFIIGVIKNYKIKNLDSTDPDTPAGENQFIIEVELIGSYRVLSEGKVEFERGAHGIPLPPNNGIELLSDEDFNKIYSCKLKDSEKFVFSDLAQNNAIAVPVNGNKLFNKHFAIVGSTGSGKSHSVASIIQKAIQEKNGSYDDLNNSHIVIFDIGGEYREAFPDANIIDSSNIKIPYWLFDSDELGDLFIESNEDNSHNQVSQFRYAVTENKKHTNPDIDSKNIYFDSPFRFNIDEVIRYIKNVNNEVIGKLEGENVPKSISGELIPDRIPKYFTDDIDFCEQSRTKATKAGPGPFKGHFERFILRLDITRNNPRLRFLFENADSLTLEDVLKQFIGYTKSKANVTIFDLSGIPFEVLSVTVSLISRILFEYGYYYKKMLDGSSECDTPLLLIFEEAHKYVPRSGLTKYRASRTAIERIAKEGRKYGITLGIVSQRPAEISETIFSQCNNFIAMRLTNPDDQNYVRKLLPDTLGDLTNYLPTLKAGEALLIGESIILPSLVKIHMPNQEPKSPDIDYLDIWKKQWKDVNFENVTKDWKNVT